MDLSKESYSESSGERKQGEVRSVQSSLGMAMEWRRRRKASCAWRYCNMSPIIRSFLVFSRIASDIESTSPRGASRRVALSGLVTMRFGALDRMRFRVGGSLQMISDFCLLRQRALRPSPPPLAGHPGHRQSCLPECRHQGTRHRTRISSA